MSEYSHVSCHIFSENNIQKSHMYCATEKISKSSCELTFLWEYQN